MRNCSIGFPQPRAVRRNPSGTLRSSTACSPVRRMICNGSLRTPRMRWPRHSAPRMKDTAHFPRKGTRCSTGWPKWSPLSPNRGVRHRSTRLRLSRRLMRAGRNSPRRNIPSAARSQRSRHRSRNWSSVSRSCMARWRMPHRRRTTGIRNSWRRRPRWSVRLPMRSTGLPRSARDLRR